MITNAEFLQTLFGDDHFFAHVTSFTDDPGNIPSENRMRCWAGDYSCRTNLLPDSNQYFTISTFYQAEDGKARRRKALFRCTHVIVADDVREKLDVTAVERLPVPTYKMETSPGSEQWGWVLDVPCQDRAQVENLLDGLVAQGLAPEGKDPGMKGVTRYVRLPEGINTKSTKMLADGSYPSCKILEWNPGHRVSLQDLARPFGVNLDAERRDARVDGAAEVTDHPILNVDTIQIKQILSDGRYDIRCPWVDGHTNQSDDGAALFTNNDGSIGFKCHHGSCEHRTGKDLIEHVESCQPGFRNSLNNWQAGKVFENISAGMVDFMGEPAEEPAAGEVSYQQMIDHLKRLPSTGSEARDVAYHIMKAADPLPHADRLVWHEQIRDHMGWNKSDFNRILEEQRAVWYPRVAAASSFYDRHVFVRGQNAFYNPDTGIWLAPEAFQNSFADQDPDARTEALVEGRCQKVDSVDYAPGHERIFSEDGITYLNGWRGLVDYSQPGEISRWLDHFPALGWTEHRQHIINFMAYTLQFPERKINHILLLGGGEGNGKDFLLQPLIWGMGRDQKTIDGDALLDSYNEYLHNVKYLHVNEADLGNRKEAKNVYNKLKSMAAAPPNYINLDIKYRNLMKIRNIVNITMTTNSSMPIGVDGYSRRFFPVWTDVSIRDESGNVTPDWQKYWDDRWHWMRDCQGWKAVVNYLRHEVDVSNFDPAAIPAQTDFMTDIRESSEDPVLSVVKELVNGKLGFLHSDIVTNADIRKTMKESAQYGLGTDLKHVPSTNVLGKIMMQSGQFKKAVMRDNDEKHLQRCWIIRNKGKYENLSQGDLFLTYRKQIREAIEKHGIKAVRKEVE